MPVVNVQVRPFDRKYPRQPWANPSLGLGAATREEMVDGMTGVGDDGAIVAPRSVPLSDRPSYALEAYGPAPISLGW